MTEKFSQHIATLLRRHDCVIVPGVGAFIATDKAAVREDDVLTPPCRSVSFNAAMVHDDGLLAGSLSRRMKISFEQARERVAAEAAVIQRRLKSEGAVYIERIGLLKRFAGGRLEFTPDGAWTLSLPAVKVSKPLPTFEVISQPAVAAEEEKAVAVVRVPLRLRWLRAAAAAIVLCVLGFTLSTPIDITTAQNASLAAPAFTPPEEPIIEPVAEPDGLALNIAMAPANGSVALVKPVPPESLKYVVVIASLPSQEKAQEFINESEIGSLLQIVQCGDKFRVYAAAGATPDDARAAASSIDRFDSRFPDAWICRR